eukprot:334314-Pyramimonas_sp.AAC.1
MLIVKQWNVTSAITHHFRRECLRGDGGGRGPSMHLAQIDSDMQYVDWGALLADPADSSAAV